MRVRRDRSRWMVKFPGVAALLGIWVALSVLPVLAAEARPETPSIGLEERVVEHRLQNGMQVLMVVRRQAPIVSINMIYLAGGVDEEAGRTGVAHLFEHMAFKGTQRLGTRNYRQEKQVLEELERVDRQIREEQAKGGTADRERIQDLQERFEQLQEEAARYVVPNEIGEIYNRHGAVGFNAGTGKDYTQYVVSLPANRIPLWIEVEHDRMVNTVLREFYKERAVVLEERRLRVDNDPFGKLYEAFLAVAFMAHPYRYPTIGWESDVAFLTPDETRRFFESYYTPQNAVLAVVGDIVPNRLVEMLEGSFGQIPARPVRQRVITREPEQAGERRIEVVFDANPQVLIGYHMPDINHADTFVLDVIDGILANGRSSRLHLRLVKEKQIAVSVSSNTNVPGGRYPGLFMIHATPRLPHTTAEVEEAIYEELERLKREPVRERELERVRNQLDAYLIRSLSTNSGLAGQLAYFQAVAGDWRYLLRARERMAEITPEEIMKVAQRYFVRNHRTVATLVRKETHD